MFPSDPALCREGVTRKHRHRAGWLRLTTSETHQLLHPPRNPRNPLFWKNLPLSLTRSRFCRQSFETTEWLQYFSGIAGGGGTLPFAPECVQEIHFGNRSETLPIHKQKLRTPFPPVTVAISNLTSVVSEPGFSRAELMRNVPGFSLCSPGQGLKPAFLRCFSAWLKPCPDTKRIFHRILRRGTGNPQPHPDLHLCACQPLRRLF